MADFSRPWYLRRTPRAQAFREVPWKRLWLFATAVFFLFSVIGFFNDLMKMGRTPYAIVIVLAIISGLDAVLWLLAVARLPWVLLLPLMVLQLLLGPVLGSLASWMGRTFALSAAPSETGVRFAGASILAVVIASYILFVSYFRVEGKESMRIRSELELAHGIQKTLVPPVSLRTERFEVYGMSQPSEKVGGDLVDALLLPNGDMIAYLADIAGHGLPAGILMGMLKTAARTVLLDAMGEQPEETLPLLMEKLNRVLPGVKEPQMYATVTAFRLNADGRAWYAMAASPPVLHWSPQWKSMEMIEQEQFPLGLLPVTGFTGQAIRICPGDVVLVATDGVLEVCDGNEQEFGVEPLKQLIAADGHGPLKDLGEAMLARVRGFGRQNDDQTLLLIRGL